MTAADPAYRPPRTCTRCGRTRKHAAQGMCRTCYSNIQRGPYLPAGGGPGGQGVDKSRDAIAIRVQRFREHREEGISVLAAAELVGVNPRTATRYEARLRDQAQEGAA